MHYPTNDYYAKFPLADGKKLKIRINAARLASSLPQACAGLQKAADAFQKAADNPDTLTKAASDYGTAAVTLCICLFGTDATRTLVDSWKGNYIGFAGALADFCARPLRRILSRHTAAVTRRCKTERRL